MKVEDLFKMQSLSGIELLAGHRGINREITSVSVMDAPDIYNWLKGGEVLMTTGYIMKDDPMRFLDLVHKINTAGAAALLIKLHRFIDKLPREVLDYAEKINFPIIYMPTKLAFTDVINPTLMEIINEQTAKLKYSEKIHKVFTNIAIKGGDLKDILLGLSRILQMDLEYLDVMFNKCCCVKDNKIEEGKLTEYINDKNKAGFITYKILLDKKKYGEILIHNEGIPLREYDYIAIEHASTVLKLHIQKQISNLQIELNHRNEFVQDLINNNIKYNEEIEKKAQIYNWSFENGGVVVIVDIDDYKIRYIEAESSNSSMEIIRENIFKDLIKEFEKYFNQLPYAMFSDSIAFIVSIDGNYIDKIRKSSDKARIRIEKKYGFTLTIGVGQAKDNIKEIHKSYKEGHKAVRLGRSMYKRNSTVFFKDLKIYNLLENIEDKSKISEFCDDTLGKLIDYDKEKNMSLVDTLRSLINNNWNLKECAANMYIHYNTMKYRFRKIEEILGVDLENGEEKIKIVISIKLMELRNII